MTYCTICQVKNQYKILIFFERSGHSSFAFIAAVDRVWLVGPEVPMAHWTWYFSEWSHVCAMCQVFHPVFEAIYIDFTFGKHLQCVNQITGMECTGFYKVDILDHKLVFTFCSGNL